MSTSDWIALFNCIAAIFIGLCVVYATFRGPLVAAKQSDDRRQLSEKRANQMNVFRLMMGHRYQVSHPNFVQGLNLVQIEFYDCKDVMAAFINFLSAFHESTNERKDCYDIRNKAIIKLLTAIGSEIGFSIEQVDIMDSIYSPQGWLDEAERKRNVLNLFSDIATGKRAFPVLTVVPEEFISKHNDTEWSFRVESENKKEPPTPVMTKTDC